MQNTLLQSLTGVAQSKKKRRQEDDSVSIKHALDVHKLRWKGKRRAVDTRGTDWKGVGRHGGV